MSDTANDTLTKVSDEFQSEVLADLEEGRSSAAAAIEAARKDSSDLVSKILDEGDRQADSITKQVIGSAELESRNAQLMALERAVNEVFDSAIKRLEVIPPGERESSVTRLIKEGIDAIGPLAIVSCNASDKKLVASVVRKLNKAPVKLSVSNDPIQTLGGVVLTTADGSVRFDNTYEARLERMRALLRRDVATLLSPPEN